MTEVAQTEGLYGQAPEGPPPGGPTLVEQVVGIFTEPVALFQRLHDTPVWKGAVTLAALCTLLMTAVWALKVDVDAMLRPVLEADPKLSGADVDRMIGMQGKLLLPLSLIGVVIAVAGGVALFALLYWLIGKGTAEGERPSYLQAASLTAMTNLVAVPHLLLTTFMCLVKPVRGLTPEKIAPSSLGYYLTVSNVKLQTLCYRLDLFTLATIALVYLGARHTLRLKEAGAAACAAVAAMLMVIIPALAGH